MAFFDFGDHLDLDDMSFDSSISSDSMEVWDEIADINAIIQACENAEKAASIIIPTHSAPPVLDTPPVAASTPGPVLEPPVPKPEPAAASSSFAMLTEEELIQLEEAKDEKTTKRTTSWGVKRVKGDYIICVNLCLIAGKTKQKIICFEWVLLPIYP